MKLEYRGNRATEYGRMAVLVFEDNEEENATKIVEELKKDEYWKSKGFDWFDNTVVIGVNDNDDFRNLMEDYKKAKKAIRNETLI